MQRIIAFIILGLPLQSVGQVVADFNIQNGANLCKGSVVQVENNSFNAQTSYWDFCPESFTESATISARFLSGFSNGFGYKLVEDNGQWFGFLLGRASNRLYRLDFGETPFSNPPLIDLGNPGGLLSTPEGLEFYQENGNWYGFTGKGDNGSGQIVRLNFGNSLLNTPTATGLGAFGLDGGRIRELRMVNQGNAAILLLIGYGSGSVYRINYGTSILNTPAAPSAAAIPGSGLLISFSIASYQSPWRLHFLSENGLVQQVSFGNDIMGSLNVEGGYSFGTSSSFKIQSIYSDGAHFSIVSDVTSKYTVVNFRDLSLSQPPSVVPNNKNANFIAFDIVKFRGKLVTQGAFGDILYTAVYEKNCSSSLGYSFETNPEAFHFTNAVTQNIDLNVSNNSTKKSKSINLVVADKVAPSLNIVSAEICAQNPINFTIAGTGTMSSMDWNFGDGNTSTLNNPSHQYGSMGQYDVSLRVVDENNCSNSVLKTIQLYDQVVPDFDLPATSPFCTNQQYVFVNAFNGDPYPVSWTWRVDGVNYSTHKDLLYSTTIGGSREISLAAEVKGCINSVAKTISEVIVGPAVDFEVSGNCQDILFQFINQTSGGGVNSYTWHFDGNQSNSTNLEYLFSAPGEYEVELTALSSNGCGNRMKKTIDVRSTPHPNFFIDLPPFSCSGTPTQFHDDTPALIDGNIVSWQWNFDDGTGLMSTQQNPTYIYPLAGTYDVSLRVETNFGCSSTIQIPIEIFESPKADFTFGPSCLNKGTQFEAKSDLPVSAWKWSIGNTFYGFQEPIHAFNSPGTYPTSLTVVGVNGCEGRITKNVDVKPIPVLDFNTSIACAGQETIFTDQTVGIDLPQSWKWDFESNITDQASPVSYTYSTPGAKPVKMEIISQSGCVYSLTKNVIVASAPIAAFAPSETFGAPPLAVQFNNSSTGASSYEWNFGFNNSSSSETNPSFAYTQLGDYLVELIATNGAGCTDVATQTVKVLIPQYNLSLEDLVIQEGTTVGAKIPVIKITNNSNVPVSQTDILLNGSSGFRLKSNVYLNLEPGATQELYLPFEIFSKEQFICLELIPAIDSDIQDNQLCENLIDQPILTAPYPNPTSGIIWLDLVLESAGSGSLQIADSMGKTVFAQEFGSLKQGMNHIEIDFSHQPIGLYMALWNVGGKQTEFRFIRQ